MSDNIESGPSASIEDNIPIEIRRKKRRKAGNVHQDSKERRNSGEPYKRKETWVPGKKSPAQVSCKCNFACKSITLEARKHLFQKFWDHGKYVEQQNFLIRLIECANINRRRHGTYAANMPEASRRQRTYRYYLLLPGNSKVEVCRKTFCETFSVGEKRVKLICKKLTGSDDIILREKRGGTRKKRDYSWKSKIIEFISSIPSRESHYGRDISSRKYLSEDLNIRKLHSAFLIKYTTENITPPVSRQWFNNIFKHNFNLSFGPPRVDTCSKCDLYKIDLKKAADPIQKKDVEMKQNLHHREAEGAQKMMSADCKLAKLEDFGCVISFDLQKQFYIPSLTHTEMYYSRQLACVNFGIHHEDEGTGFFYLWDETTGKRGCNEIGSCIFDFLTNQLNTPKKSLILWSDNCGGQNKNQGILAVYITLVAKGYFNEILHKFPQTGHTFLSCDRDFGLIEKVKRRKKPEVPRDLIKIIASARQNKPFTIKHTGNFFDWMSIAKKSLKTDHLGISQTVMLRIDANLLQEGLVEVKNNYSEVALFRKVKIFKQNTTIDYFKNLDVILSQSDPKNPWSAAKIREIQNMIPSLKPKNQVFYDQLIQKMIEYTN